MASQHLTFHTDPGHGWLEVLRADLVRFGIADSISQFSYSMGQVVFLEEDCDAPKYLEALRSRAIDYIIRDVHYNRDAPIRAMNPYRAPACPINRGQQPLSL